MDKGSQSQQQPRLGVTRSTSASTTTSLSKSGAGAEDESKAKKEAVPESCIDMSTFEQILELDEDDPERTFSIGIVQNYYEQVETTFQQMEDALAKKDVATLSSLGHFLKGSSAALGVTKMQATCEMMQHYGHLKEADGTGKIDKDEAVKRIDALVVRVRGEFVDAKTWFDDFFAKS